MVGKIFRSRAVARAAVVWLTLGVFALAALAAFSISGNAKTTAHIRRTAAVSDQWGQFNLNVSIEYEALNDYLRATSEVGRQPLVSAMGSGNGNLAWLSQHGDATDVEQSAETADSYASYTTTLSDLLAAADHGDQDDVEALAEEAALSASMLRKSAIANVTRIRLATDQYLADADLANQRLRTAAEVIGGVDFLLLVLCALVLLTHQRRVEGQAVESRHRALHDELTGLANRALLADEIDLSLRRAEQHGEAVGLLLLDLNKFKEVNDTLGHHAGDLLLQEVATRLRGAIRDHDTVARLGGDEFAILLPKVGSADDCMEIARRLLDGLEGPADLGGVLVDISGSIGAAVYPALSTTGPELLQHADIAMYIAKRNRLGTALYNAESNNHSSQQLGLIAELRRAIDEDELVLHYQPKVVSGTGQLAGVEALVRWEHPTRGLLQPGEFIPQAEESDIIVPMTDAVLDMTLRQLRLWSASGTTLSVAINVPTACLHDVSFVDRVAAALATHEVPAGQLTLEITETSIITDVTRASAVLGELRALGVGLSVDDFGTGYSSMAYLQKMPLTELKIDRSFVRDMDESSGDVAIVRAIVELALALELDVVAEGVETAEALATLTAMGCALAQGYYITRPLPPAELDIWMARRSQPLAAAPA